MSKDLWIVRDDKLPVNSDAGNYVYKIDGRIYRVTITIGDDGKPKKKIGLLKGDFDPDKSIREFIGRNNELKGEDYGTKPKAGFVPELQMNILHNSALEIPTQTRSQI